MLHKERLVILFLLIMFGVFFVKCDKDYNELLEVNDDLVETIELNSLEYSEVVHSWEESYDRLQEDYAELIVENDKLSSELEDFELPEYEYTEAEVELLAMCVQCEAGVRNVRAQKMITGVILNRVKDSDYPDTIEEVIYDKENGIQFSVSYDGAMDEIEEVSPQVLSSVYSVLVHGSDLPEEVMYFYSESLKEDNWVKSLEVYDTVEGTVFAYKKGE